MPAVVQEVFHTRMLFRCQFHTGRPLRRLEEFVTGFFLVEEIAKTRSDYRRPRRMTIRFAGDVRNRFAFSRFVFLHEKLVAIPFTFMRISGLECRYGPAQRVKSQATTPAADRAANGQQRKEDKIHEPYARSPMVVWITGTTTHLQPFAETWT